MSKENGNLKCFINNDLYFWVDKEERRSLREETLEGTLGFIIKLHSSLTNDINRALKIPKLHGATHRENAYINQLMEIEELAASDAGTSNGLVPAKHERILRGFINTEGSNDPEAVSQHNSLYLIQYQPGKNPRFLQINEANIDDWQDKIGQVDFEEFSNFVKDVSKKAKDVIFSSTTFIQKRSDDETNTNVESLLHGKDENFNYFDQWTAAELYSAKNTLYAFVPSVVYDWATGTLQEAITRQAKKVWSKQDYLRFLDEIAQGIASLHKKKFIHADIRPANIMYFGDSEIAPRKPESYKLGDYGSFASASENFHEKLVNPSGRTRLARAFEGERISEFYAPERISGIERETVDLAHIFKPGQREDGSELKDFWVVLGLKNQKLMQEVDKVREIVTKLDRGDDKNYSSEDDIATPEPDGSSAVDDNENDVQTPQTISNNKLKRRDRIQIQNYIFELKDTEIHQDGLQIFKCDAAPTQVVQKRIAVDAVLDTIPANLAVDRIIELKQWSAAADLYSLGVLALYIIFMDQFQDIFQLQITRIKDAEDKFRSMVRILSDREYFQTLWPQLEAFRNAFERNSGNPGIAKNIFPADEYSVGIEDVESIDSEPDQHVTSHQSSDAGREQPNYREFAKSLVTRVTAYVPGAKRLIEQLEDNVALFLLFLHFSLCCLHRENHVTGKALSPWMKNSEKQPIFPFSKDRIEAVNDEAIGKALSRLKELNRIVYRDEVKKFKLTPEEMEQIPEYNPGNPGMILYQKVQLENKVKVLKTKMDEFIGISGEQQTSIDDSQRQLEQFLEVSDDRDQIDKVWDLFKEHQALKENSFSRKFIPPNETKLMNIFAVFLKSYVEMSDDIRRALEEHGQPE